MGISVFLLAVDGDRLNNPMYFIDAFIVSRARQKRIHVASRKKQYTIIQVYHVRSLCSNGLLFGAYKQWASHADCRLFKGDSRDPQ